MISLPMDLTACPVVGTFRTWPSGPLNEIAAQFGRASGHKIVANSKEPEAAKAFVTYLMSQAAIAVIKAKGMSPG